MRRLVIRRRVAALVGGAAACGMLVAGAVWFAGPGGSGSDDTRSGRGSTATPTPSAGGSTGGATGSGVPGSPTPPRASEGAAAATDDATRGFLTEVGAIDPVLVTDPDRAVTAGRETCQDIQAMRPEEAVAAAAVQRFRVEGAAITQTKAVLLVGASRNHLCPAG